MASLQEIFAKMATKDFVAHSELGSRDESRQSKNFGTRIQKLRPAVGINARMLIFKDVVVPFNPFTGDVDEMYNPKSPFRPILLVRQVLRGINEACLANPELKALWEKKISFNITEVEPTLEEYYAFKHSDYIKTRVMSYDTVRLSFAGRCGFPEFGCNYTVDSAELNETRSYNYENAPIWHRGAAFFNALIKPEIDQAVTRLQAEGATEERIKLEKQAIKSKSPVSFVNPTNLTPFLYIPFIDDIKEIAEEDYRGVESYMRYMRKTFNKLDPVLDEVFKDDINDVDIDYFDLTIKTASPTAKKANGSVYTDQDFNELYGTMTIAVTNDRAALGTGKVTLKDGSIHDCKELYANLLQRVDEYFIHSQLESTKEDGDTFEKIMAASNKFRPITTAMDNFLPACNEVFNATFAQSPFMTDDVRRSNADFLIAMNPDNSLALAADEPEDIEAAKAGAKESVSQMILEERSLHEGTDLAMDEG